MKAVFKLVDRPSKSKGWGRYCLILNGITQQGLHGSDFINGTTAIELDVKTGDLLEIWGQCQLTEGRLNKKTTYTDKAATVVEIGKSGEYRYYPGSQGITVSIEFVSQESLEPTQALLTNAK